LQKIKKYAITILILATILYMSNNLTIPTKAGTVIPGGTVKVIPRAISPIEIGKSFTINVTATDVPPIYGLQVQLKFDPTILNVTNVIQGDFLTKSGINTFHFWNVTDENIMTYAETLIVSDPDQLVGGDGVICTINFTVTGEGASVLELVAFESIEAEIGTFFLKPSDEWSPTRPDYDYIIPQIISGYYGSAIEITLSKTTITVGNSVNVTCTAHPEIIAEEPPFTINVTLTYKSGEEWKKINSTTINVESAEPVEVMFKWTPPEEGKYTLKAFLYMDETMVDESGEVTLTVKAKGGGIDLTTIIIIVIVVVIVIGAIALYLKRRK